MYLETKPFLGNPKILRKEPQKEELLSANVEASFARINHATISGVKRFSFRALLQSYQAPHLQLIIHKTTCVEIACWKCRKHEAFRFGDENVFPSLSNFSWLCTHDMNMEKEFLFADYIVLYSRYKLTV